MSSTDYAKDILDSVDPHVEKKGMTIRHIREKAGSLPEMSEVVRELESSMPAVMQSFTDEHQEFVDGLDQEQRNKINRKLLEQREVHSKLMDDGVSEKIQGAAYNIALLKLSIVNKDYRQVRMLMNKFIAQEDMAMKTLLAESDELNRMIKKAVLFNHEFAGEFAGNAKLEHGVEINKKNPGIDKLRKLGKDQQQLAYEIATKFTEMSKDLLKDKEYKKYLKSK